MDNRKIDVILINFKDEIDDEETTTEFMNTLEKYRQKLVKLFAIPVVSNHDICPRCGCNKTHVSLDKEYSCLNKLCDWKCKL